METWEKELREKLDKSTKHGAYNFSLNDFVFITGKEGAINMEVALRKEMIRQGIITNEELNGK